MWYFLLHKQICSFLIILLVYYLARVESLAMRVTWVERPVFYVFCEIKLIKLLKQLIFSYCICTVHILFQTYILLLSDMHIRLKYKMKELCYNLDRVIEKLYLKQDLILIFTVYTYINVKALHYKCLNNTKCHIMYWM